MPLTDADLRNVADRLHRLETILGLNQPTAPSEPAYGIDVYRGQGEVDWEQVAAHGVSFAIIKATEGVNFVDKRLRDNAEGAYHNGLRVGYYHFGRPDTGSDHMSDARAEAGDFLEAIANLPDPSIMHFEPDRFGAVWLDLEKAVTNLDEREGLEWVLEWCRVVEQQWPVGLYTSGSWLTREATPDGSAAVQLATREDGSIRPFWVARYGPNDGKPHPEFDPNKKVPAPWNHWDIWQYTSTARIPGVPTRCDMNLLRRMAPADTA